MGRPGGLSVPITDPLVIPADVTITAVRELSPRLRSRLGAADDDFAISRPRGRAPARLIPRAAAALLEEFRTPRQVSAVILTIAARQGADPDALLSDAFPLLHDCYAARFLVAADSPDAGEIAASQRPGDRAGKWTIMRCVRLLSDTELYQARTRAGRPVALKLMREPPTPELRRMFAREAAVLTRLAGRGAPRLLGRGRIGNRPYLVMSWCSGVEPMVAFDAARAEGRPAVRRLAVRIAAAYAHLHRAGVLHGDVCPGNLLIDRRGSVVLLDFGRASFRDRAGLPRDPPRGFVPPLLDPELAAALAAGAASPPPTTRGEQFTVAALLYLLITGRYHQDFAMDRSVMLAQAATGTPRAFASHGAASWPSLEAVLRRALNVDPGRRFPSVAAFTRALGRTTAARPARRTSADDGLVTAFIADMAESSPLDRLTSGAPIASVTYGMAGVACALYRLALIRSDARALAAADLWITRAVAEQGRPNAFRATRMGLSTRAIGAVSPYHTVSGVHVVNGLVAQALGDEARLGDAVLRYTGAVARPCASRDLTLGRAGILVGASLLLDVLPESMVAESTMLRDVGNAALKQVWSGGSGGLDDAGIAHGVGGLVYATWRWCGASGAPVPGPVAPALERLAAGAEPAGRGVHWPRIAANGSTGDDVPGWCKGPAGMVYLWTAAHRASGEPAHLRLAESSGWSAWDAASRYPDLCCGLAGRAYALLALYRYTGNDEWLRRARVLGERARSALDRVDRLPHPLSLFKGVPGIVLLLADLEHPEEARMPFFEAEGWMREEHR
jgi:serine/threonine-protein kinase